MTRTLQERPGLSGNATSGLPPEPSGFLSAYPGYSRTALLDQLRAAEHPTSTRAVTSTSTTPARACRPRRSSARMPSGFAAGASGIRTLRARPPPRRPNWSSGPASRSWRTSTRRRRSTRPSSLRTPRARAAWSAEAYPFGPRTRFVLTYDNHNSVNGIREFARVRGAAVEYVPFSWRNLRVDDDEIRQALAQRRRRGLLAYPAQSNFSGVQHPLSWINTAHEHGYDVLLDAAAYVPSKPAGPFGGQARFRPCQLVQGVRLPDRCRLPDRAAGGAETPEGPWFAGGSVHIASVVQADWHALAAGEAGFEDGTTSFLQIPDLEDGLSWVNGIGLDRIHERVMCLTGWLLGLAATCVTATASRWRRSTGLTVRATAVASSHSTCWIRTARSSMSALWRARPPPRGISILIGGFLQPGCRRVQLPPDQEQTGAGRWADALARWMSPSRSSACRAAGRCAHLSG